MMKMTMCLLLVLLIDMLQDQTNLQEMCLAKFAVNYDVISTKEPDDIGSDKNCNENDDELKTTDENNKQNKIKLKNRLGCMKKRKQESILWTKRYKSQKEPEKYYHSKLILYYPWISEEELINGFGTYHDSYINKQDIIHENAKHFNDNCELFDLSPEDIENNIPQSVWDLTTAAKTLAQGYTMVQKFTQEEFDDTDIQWDQTKSHHIHSDSLGKLYMKAVTQNEITFSDYCKHTSLNEQHHIVMFNRAWCKSYINAIRNKQTLPGYHIFLSGPGGTGKMHVLKLIQRDMNYFLPNIVNCDPDQPIVLMTAPTGSAAFQIGGSTINSTFLVYDNGRNKPSWGEKTVMQTKLQHLTLLVNDEVSMVRYKKFQCMNETICTIKGTQMGDWGNICVLAVGDMYQLPPVGQSPIYVSPPNINCLSDFASNGWDDMKLHELTQTMRQKDTYFT